MLLRAQDSFPFPEIYIIRLPIQTLINPCKMMRTFFKIRFSARIKRRQRKTNYRAGRAGPRRAGPRHAASLAGTLFIIWAARGFHRQSAAILFENALLILEIMKLRTRNASALIATRATLNQCAAL